MLNELVLIVGVRQNLLCALCVRLGDLQLYMRCTLGKNLKRLAPELGLDIDLCVKVVVWRLTVTRTDWLLVITKEGEKKGQKSSCNN